jgi:hypothetical protein
MKYQGSEARWGEVRLREAGNLITLKLRLTENKSREAELPVTLNPCFIVVSQRNEQIYFGILACAFLSILGIAHVH